MKYYKLVSFPARHEKQLDHRTCDLCKNVIEEPKGYEVEEIAVSCKTGYAYPDNGHGHLIDIDLCLPCFQDKLLTWFRSQGVKIQTEEWEW